MKIQVKYFAILKDKRGLSHEELNTELHTPEEVYRQLKAQYEFPLEADRLRVAINDEFDEWETPLQEGDSLVFIPPVAGG